MRASSSSVIGATRSARSSSPCFRSMLASVSRSTVSPGIRSIYLGPPGLQLSKPFWVDTAGP
jgi:hypothetical protein